MLFLDGVGLGDDDPGRNPFAAAHAPALAALAGGRWLVGLPSRAEPTRVVRSIDATLGAPGLPQSATGQTTLLTGRDAVAEMGRPYGPWPGPRLRRLLAAGSLFADALADPAGAAAPGAGPAGAALANAYPAAYLDALARPAGRHRRTRAPAAVVAAEAAGVRLRDADDWRAGRAVAADLDGGRLPAAGTPVAADARREARALAGLADGHRFTYFDVWLPDHVGHTADLAAGVRVVERLDAFVEALWAALPPHVTLLVTSDHGNLEDAGHARHTRAPVPLVAAGPAASAFADVVDLCGIAAAIRAVWTAQRPSSTSSTASYQAPSHSSSPAGTSNEAAARAADG